MLRGVFTRMAPKATLAAASTDAITNSRAISRILATNPVAAFPATLADKVIQKTGGDGAAGAAALLARSQILLSNRKDLTSVKVALADADAALKVVSSAGSNANAQLRRLALVTRVRIFNMLLDEQETLLANGAGKEGDVSTARSLVREAYGDLVKLAANDAFALIGLAEFELYEGNASAALDGLNAAERALSSDVAVNSADSPAARVAYQFCSAVSAAASCDGPSLSSKTLEDVRKRIVSGKATIGKDEAAELKSLLKTEAALTDEELTLLAVVLDAAESSVHPGDFFPLKESYRAWHSESATSLYHDVAQFVNGETVTVSPATVKGIRDAKPSASFFGGDDALKQVLARKDVTNILDTIESSFGTGPTTALSSHDDAFQSALQSIDEVSESASLQKRLTRQVELRMTVNRAIALERLNQPHEALKLLDAVISGDEYLYMWKAFLARGRIRRNLGLVAEADADFKELFTLRTPYVNADIPLRDEHRTKSIF